MSPKSLFVVEQEDQNSNRLVDWDDYVGGDVWREIENMVAYEGLDGVEWHERFSRWELRMTRAGFRPVRMWYNSDEDAKQMVGLQDESKHAAKVPMVLAVTLDWFSVITEVQEEITG
ncbi:unnamed protein product [Linum trigynum]|uniref:Uncharacterized protein n=1 Tax=Linum trigynum TaxID=586398 RepID=A0AAV2GDY1_9ROSI